MINAAGSPTFYEFDSTELLELYKTGQGPIKMRGTWEKGPTTRGTQSVFITSVPYGVNKAELVESIAQIVINRKMPHLTDVKDVSTDDVRIELELKRDAEVEKVMAYLFKNTDPRGSLRANVSNATVRCLSNMPLAEMLETRHTMSQVVRTEVSPQSEQWGYRLGSVYIRKVHFRDAGMIRQIEEKVVNRLRQVTSAIRQAGANQVSVISSSAEREASIEFAKAAAIRPNTLGMALEQIARVPAVSSALFEILETQRLLDSHTKLTLLPKGGASKLLTELLAAGAEPPERPEPPALPQYRLRRE